MVSPETPGKSVRVTVCLCNLSAQADKPLSHSLLCSLKRYRLWIAGIQNHPNPMLLGDVGHASVEDLVVKINFETLASDQDGFCTASYPIDR